MVQWCEISNFCFPTFSDIRMGDYYDSSYEVQCPVCKGTKYRNPQMKLMVNVCGHPQCDACVRMNFIKGKVYAKKSNLFFI